MSDTLHKYDIAITGVAGFIGSNLLRKLLEKNYSVIGIDNLSYGAMENIQPFLNNKNFRFINGDATEPQTMKGWEANYLVHLASQKIPRYDNALRTMRENDLLLNNVIEKCLSGSAKLIFASTSDVYGKNTNIPFHEDSDLTLGPSNIKRWAYAASKIHSEHTIIAYGDASQLKYTIVRFFGSYGPNQNLTWWGGPQSGFITNSFNKLPLEIHGDGLQTRTFTYIEDTVNALVKCIFEEKSLNEIFNIASLPEEEISIKQLAHLIWKLVNGEDSEPLLKFVPYSSFGKYEDVKRRVPDISKIKTILDFHPEYSIHKGLQKTIEWQKNKLDEQ